MGKDVVETIHYFGEQKKLFKVHFRNVNQPLPHFVETFIDDGYMDMYKVMKAMREVDFDGVLIADHIPMMANDHARRHGLHHRLHEGAAAARQRRGQGRGRELSPSPGLLTPAGAPRVHARSVHSGVPNGKGRHGEWVSSGANGLENAHFGFLPSHPSRTRIGVL